MLGCHRDKTLNALDNFIKFMIGRLDIAIEQVCNQEQAAARVVEGNNDIGKQIYAIGNSEACSCEASFGSKWPTELVAQIAHQPSDEAWHTRLRRGLEAVKFRLQEVSWIAPTFIVTMR